VHRRRRLPLCWANNAGQIEICAANTSGPIVANDLSGVKLDKYHDDDGEKIMSNGDLEARVGTLESRLDELITNLAENNSMLLDALDALVETSSDSRARQDAVNTVRGGICTNNPPGCHV
jgi:hypothetical protein